MNIAYDSEDVILLVVLEDGGGPITGIAHDTVGFSLKVYKPGSAAPATPTLQEGTLGTFLPNSWKEYGEGVYQFCLSNVLLAPGKMVLLDFVLPGGEHYRDVLECVGVGSSTATNSTQTLILDKLESSGSTEFVFNIPGFEPISANNTTIYVKEKNRELIFTADRDIESETITLIFEDPVTKEDLVIVPDGSLTKAGNSFTYLLPEEFTEEPGEHYWGIRIGSDNLFCGSGRFEVIYAPHVDPSPGP